MFLHMVDVNIHLLLSALVNAPICPPLPGWEQKLSSEKKRKSCSPASCLTLAPSTQWTMIVNNTFQLLHSVYNSWQHLRFDNSRWSSSVDDSCCLMPSQSAGRIKVWTLFFTWNQNISGEGVSGEDLNVPTESVVPTSTVTMGLPCLVFEIWPLDGQQRCTKDGRRTDNGPTLARVAYLAL